MQGFNFIVGRILKIVQHEEKAFWIFVTIIENILPANFYSEMAGLMVDADLVLLLLQRVYPELMDYMEENFFLDYFKNILFQWMLSLFIHNFSSESSLLIWDILFIDKGIVIFKTIIGLIKLIQNKIFEINTLEEFKNYIRNFFDSYIDVTYLRYITILKKYEFNQNTINKNRHLLQNATIIHINQVNLNKANKLKEKVKTLNSFCDHNWPICIYDYMSYYSVVDYFIFKSVDFSLIEDYFSPQNFIIKAFSSNTCSISTNLNYSGALIERKPHCCDNKFKYNIKVPTGFSIALEQINQSEEGINTDATDEKSIDDSIGLSSPLNKKIDQKLKTPIIEYKERSMARKDSLKSMHELTKTKYKKIRKDAKIVQTISLYNCNEGKEDMDKQDYFGNFVSKINIKCNNSYIY